MKKIIACVLAIVLMATPVSVSADTAFDFSDLKYVSIWQAARVARAEMAAHEPTVTVYIKSSNGNAEEVFQELQEEVMKETENGSEGDYMLWNIDSQQLYYTYRPVTIGRYTYYYYDFNITIEYFTTLEQKNQVDQKVKELIKDFKFTEKTTDYKKVKTIYDYVCKNVKYAKDVTKKEVYTSWSALFKKEAVCQGYAQLIYRMLKEVGISCRIISGYDTNMGVRHGWNIVKIGDYYYNVDATWDAQYAAAGKSYKYFLKGDDFANHKRMDTFTTTEFYAKYPMAAKAYSEDAKPTASANSKASAFKNIKPKFKNVSRKKIKLTKVPGAYKYQIRYSTRKNFKKGTKTKTTKKTTYKLKKLKSTKAYYVKFRAYKYINKKKTYTKWSKVKKIKKK